MLAWVHQATASEHEFLEGLLGVKEKRRMVGAERNVHEGEEEEIVHDALDKDLEGLSRPLKVCCDWQCQLEARIADISVEDADTADDQIAGRHHYGI